MKNLAGYLVIVIIIAAAAFAIDVLSSNVGVSFHTITWVDSSGKTFATQNADFPLWHQIARLLTNFLYGLAAVIFVTVFVADKIQRSQRDKEKEQLEKFREAVNVDVFDSLFKTIIPSEIFAVIKQGIIKSPTVRRKAKWIYDFQETKEDEILCRVTNHYQVHNVSQAEVQNPVKMELNPLGGEDYRVVEAKCVASDRKKVLVRYRDDSPDNNTNISITKGEKTIIEYTVSVPPGGYVEYTAVFERYYKGKSITDAQFTKMPVVDAELIANFPAGYKFNVSPHFSSDLRLVSESLVQKIYTVEGGILPEQGFLFYLNKLPTAAS